MRHPFLSSTMAMLIGLTVLAVRPSYAQPVTDPTPQPLLAYQGRVIEGTVPVTGSRIFTFSILDSNGQELWNSGNQALSIEGGLYGVVLGSTGMPPIPAGLLSRSNMSLRITLSGLALTPDVNIIPALQARSAWELIGPFGGDLSGTQNVTLLMNLQGTPLDLISTPPTTGQALVFNGSKWIASSVVGTPGPAGPTGPQGATGSQGPLGPQGLIGLTGPTGVAGPAGVNGINGTNGLDGKTTLNGAGSPVATNAGGTSGDFYLDTINNLLYGPKVGPTWAGVIGVSLVGPSGAIGPQGLTGATGSQGPIGPQGLIGLTGPTGVAGPAGVNGINGTNGLDGKTTLNGAGSPVATNAGGTSGDFYLDTTNNLLYGPKVGPTWAGVTGVSLVGPSGASGPQGVIGLTGPSGAVGATGAQGVIGLTGPSGAVGATGATGAQGVIGLTGPSGAAGATGATGTQGVIGLTGPSGAVGATGAQGVIGLTGPSGAVGATGATGATGAQGVIGLTGPAGAAGATGAQGVIGLTGPAGAAGATGSQGVIGLTGPAGAAGATGAQGVIGLTGPQGASGLLAFGYFYALMPGDNAATIAAGAAVLFPQSGAANGISRFGGTSTSEFTLPAVGTYEVFWQVSIAEAGQLVLGINGTEQAHTVAGRAALTTQITNHVLLVTTLPNSLLSVRNPAGNPAALTVTPIAGGTLAVSASLLIKQIQ